MRYTIHLFLSFCLFLIGCFTQKAYPGIPLPDSKIAVITPRGVDIFRVDNEKQGWFGNGISLLPGEHEVELSFNSENFVARGPDDITDNRRVVRFKVEANKRYYVFGSPNIYHSGICAWVEEEDTKKVVSDPKNPCGLSLQEKRK